MGEIKQSTREKRIKDFIKDNKFLTEKQWKNTIIDYAHWESWVAQGQCGKCKTCKANPIAHIRNKRKFDRNTSHNKKGSHIHTGYFCHDCINEVVEQLGIKFKKDYAP